MAIQLICDGESCHSFESAGTTAEPLNQSAIPSNSAMERRVKARQRRGWGIAILRSCTLLFFCALCAFLWLWSQSFFVSHKHCGQFVQPFSILIVEPADKRTIQIEDAEQSFAIKQRHH